MGRLIDADALDSKLDALAKRYAEQKRFEVAKDYSFIQTVLLSAPTIDAVPVVRCGECVLHGHCLTEDSFHMARIKEAYCCAGKRREVGNDG